MISAGPFDDNARGKSSVDISYSNTEPLHRADSFLRPSRLVGITSHVNALYSCFPASFIGSDDEVYVKSVKVDIDVSRRIWSL